MNCTILANTAKMGREEWLALRRQGLGGSDAGAVMGMSPWASPMSVYMDKRGLAPEREETEPMRFGRDLEEYVARRFTEQTGKKVRRRFAMLQSVEHPFMLANLDYMVVNEFAGLECKTTNVLNASGYKKGDIPLHYYLQCQHYMAVTGLQRFYLAVYVLQEGLHVFAVDRDKEEIAILIEREKEFWEGNVLAQKVPEPDGSDASQEAIDTLYPTGKDDLAMHIGPDSELIFADYFEFKAMADRYAKIADTKKQMIQALMGEASFASGDRFRVHWKNVVQNRIDTKRLKDEEPAIYQAYLRTTITRPFKAEITKEE